MPPTAAPTPPRQPSPSSRTLRSGRGTAAARHRRQRPLHRLRPPHLHLHPPRRPTICSACSTTPPARRSSPRSARSRPCPRTPPTSSRSRSEEHTSELQSRGHLVCRLLLDKKNKNNIITQPPPHSRLLHPSAPAASLAPRPPPSLPTRRSSDLAPTPAPAPASAAPADDLFSLFDDATGEAVEPAEREIPAVPADAPDFEQITAREQLLLTDALRSDPPSAAELLHPSFTEVGASGRRLDREEILAHLAPLDRVEAAEFVADEIAPGVVLLRYVTTSPTRSVERTSVWVQEDGRWLLRHHQGTPVGHDH